VAVVVPYIYVVGFLFDKVTLPSNSRFELPVLLKIIYLSMAMGAIMVVTGVVYIIILYATLHGLRCARGTISRTSVITHWMLVGHDADGSAVTESENHR